MLRHQDSISPAGFFFEPTVFTDVEDHMFIAKEESFGPVMIISRFADGYGILLNSPGPGTASDLFAMHRSPVGLPVGCVAQ